MAETTAHQEAQEAHLENTGPDPGMMQSGRNVKRSRWKKPQWCRLEDPGIGVGTEIC
jgi:DNA-binding sugar fermentation-stimulating protein